MMMVEFFTGPLRNMEFMVRKSTCVRLEVDIIPSIPDNSNHATPNKMSKIQANQICIIHSSSIFVFVLRLNLFGSIFRDFRTQKLPQMMDAQLDDMDDQQRVL